MNAQNASQSVEAMRQKFQGTIVLPEDSEYEQLRSVMMRQGSPVVIAMAETPEDVTLALSYAKEHRLVVSIRSGGHSNAAQSTNDGGIIVDVSRMNDITLIDPTTNRVRVGAGAKWGDVAEKLYSYGLGISSGDTKSVGVSGLTLGGGIGWMVRKYGLAIDSLVSADIVTADGSHLTANADTNADLFWAIRGGGGNFGVITALEFTAHKVSDVSYGVIAFSADNASEIIKKWRDYMRIAPEELTTMALLMPDMGQSPASVMFMVCWGGDPKITHEVLAPLRSLGTVTSDTVTTMPYYKVLEEAHPPQGMHVEVNNAFFSDFSDTAIEKVIDGFTKHNMIFQIRSVGGAMNRIPEADTAFAHRNSEVLIVAPQFFPIDISEPDVETALQPWRDIAAFSNGAYSNFFSQPNEQAVHMSYPADTYLRLKAIKEKYDPQNVFNQNLNIK